MAVVQNTLIGRATGRVGNAVFSQWKGRNILKQLPTIVSNPRSAQQQSNRMRFVMLLAIGKLLMSSLRIGFKEFSGSVTWLNKFMSMNSYSGFAVWDEPTLAWVPDYTKLIVSDGSLFPTTTTVTVSTPTTVTIVWPVTNSGNQYNDDKLIAVIMCGDKTISMPVEDRITGTSSYVSITPLFTVGDPIYVYTFFYRADGSIVSSSYVADAVITV